MGKKKMVHHCTGQGQTAAAKKHIVVPKSQRMILKFSGCFDPAAADLPGPKLSGWNKDREEDSGKYINDI